MHNTHHQPLDVKGNHTTRVQQVGKHKKYATGAHQDKHIHCTFMNWVAVGDKQEPCYTCMQQSRTMPPKKIGCRMLMMRSMRKGDSKYVSVYTGFYRDDGGFYGDDEQQHTVNILSQTCYQCLGMCSIYAVAHAAFYTCVGDAPGGAALHTKLAHTLSPPHA